MTLEIPREWAWTSDVADNFGDHVREQLPWYDIATAGVVQIGRHYIPELGNVEDIGCATGNISRALAPVINQRRASLSAFDSSVEMVDRFTFPGPHVVECADVRQYDFIGHDFAVSFLTLMFLPPAHVRPTIARIVEATAPGGAFVLVERTEPVGGYASLVMSRLTLNAKREAGANSDDIITKELALAGVQRPISAAVLAEFGAVEWFRFADFGGYLIEKPA